MAKKTDIYKMRQDGSRHKALKEAEKMNDFNVSFDDYNEYCSECPSHDTCHKDKHIDYDKVAKCKKEQLRLFLENKNEG